MDAAYLSRLEAQKSDLEQAMGELDNEISLITSSYDPNLEDKLNELRQKLEQTGAELNAVETAISRYAGTLTISTAPVDPDKFLDFTGDTMGIFTDPKGNIVSITTRPGTGIQYPTNTGALQDMTGLAFTGASLLAPARLILPKGPTVPPITVPVEKFSNYIFKEGATHGKDVVFRNLGYDAKDSAQLATLFQQQAAAKYAQGHFTSGAVTKYGQRMSITIDVPGIGAAAGKTTSITAGFLIRPDGGITLSTPFSGFPKP